ncbi:MAG TPA: hypothetical protein VK474_00405 [Chthoniobacterales bacterium]|nr:hypothetical protein [Chthoniobacterales bacterium]
MNWTLPELWRTVTNAWSSENLPYMIAFWVAVGGLVAFLNYRHRQRPDSD